MTLTPEQKTILLCSIQLGLACDLHDPIEWYVNARHHAMSHEEEQALPDIYVEFYRGMSPEYADMDLNGLDHIVANHYE